MDAKLESRPTILDTILLLLSVVILVGSIYAYYYFANENALLRTAGVMVAFIVAVWVALQSAQGRTLWAFVQSSRGELRRVVWPTREEALQTTLIVIVFAAIMGTFFWLLDTVLLLITRLITGQGA